MYDYDEMYYNQDVQSRINCGSAHCCENCGELTSFGVYINGDLFCSDCAREYLESLDEYTIMDRLCIAEGEDIWAVVARLSIDYIADCMGWDMWEN